ncbi:hypothetical protein [Cereibacter sphaeroides]|uniref:hypothetical protein n=1 Tax=Cereibacter sphaeroides TaxID=1063 RepID=UPI002155FBB5|nr:hypothetical protein [Cereibacter sphaeroides]
MNDLNPYQALLNDPDPARAQAAMQIMLESGDADLTRMALEYGLLSPNPTVQAAGPRKLAVYGSCPVHSVRRNEGAGQGISRPGSRTTGTETSATGSDTGAWASENTFRISKCFSNNRQADRCFITVNGDGVFLTPEALNGRAVITDTGQLEGTGALYGIEEPVSFSIRPARLRGSRRLIAPRRCRSQCRRSTRH